MPLPEELVEAAKGAARAERDRLVYPADEVVADWVIESIAEAVTAVVLRALRGSLAVKEAMDETTLDLARQREYRLYQTTAAYLDAIARLANDA